jgi:hypothetical protein
MAFQPSASRAPAASSNAQNDAWKAQGFLNLYLPGPDGKQLKLGAIPLKESNVRGVNEKKMLAWLNEDPSRVSIILSKLTIEYRPVVETESAGFDMSVTPAPAPTDKPF